MSLGKTDRWIISACIVMGSLIGVYYSDIKTLYKNLTSSDSYTLAEALDREIDIGVIAKDQEAKAFFGIVNKGNVPLEIERVETTCHCTEGAFQLLPAGSGDTLYIEVVYDKHKPGFFYQDV